jgi:hypothetical protein
MESSQTGRRALIAALISSPIFVGLVVKYFDPIAWYREYHAPPPMAPVAPPPPPMANVVVSGQMFPFTGMHGHGVFQSPTKYTIARVDMDIANLGKAPSNDLYVQLTFSNDMLVEKVTGDWDMQYKLNDGTFRPIEQANSWDEDNHYVVLHIPKLGVGLSESAKITFDYLTGKPAEQPKVDCWDSDTKYTATWKAPSIK